MRRSAACALLSLALVACRGHDAPVAVGLATATRDDAPADAAVPEAPRAEPRPPLSSTTRIVGRADLSNPASAQIAWAGTALVAQFRGTSLNARLRFEGRDVLQVVVDGETKGTIKADPSRSVFSVAQDLPSGVHEVALYKRTEPHVGTFVFDGFEAPGGVLLPPPQPKARRIELIGDSITAGYGNEGPRAICPFQAKEENEYATYGAIAARALDAEHVTIAWSGKTIREMSEYWERTLPDRPDSRWSHAAFVPQLVVVNLGTNDFALRDPGEARFVQRYTALVAKLRAAYPDALIVCCLGPMLTNRYPAGRNTLTRARSHLKATVAKLAREGDAKVEFLEFPEQKHADGLGCGFHPSLKTHKIMAERLVTFARRKLGW